jgi:hypothetical protein
MKIIKSMLLAVAAWGGLFTVADPAFAQTWTQTSAPSTNWVSVTSSADGSKLAAAVYRGGIYTSTNSGIAWTQSSAPANNYWRSVASSADGIKLVAVSFGIYTSGIWISTNSGNTWIQTSVASNEWTSVASSTDGSKLVVVAIGDIHFNAPGFVYTSTNFGTTWTQQTNAPGFSWTTVASAADGNKLAVFTADEIYISTNSGNTWKQANNPPQDWAAVGSSQAICWSADGSRLAVALSGGNFQQPLPIYISTNLGVTWTLTSAPTNNWTSVASSSDGSKLAATSIVSSNSTPGPIYTSTNFGITWTSSDVSGMWTSVAMSADGSKLVAVSRPGGIYTLQTTPAPQLNLATSSSNLALSWIIPSTNFVLQQSSDLTSWADVTNTPVLNLTNLQNEVILSPTSSSGFYRLKTP